LVLTLARRYFTWWHLAITARVLLKKKFSQKQLIAFTANMQTLLDRDGGMFGVALPLREGCCGWPGMNRRARLAFMTTGAMPYRSMKPSGPLIER
jgi:hypothetical protein